MRWVEGVQKDLQEMKFTIWRQKAADREEWTLVIKEGKAIIGP